MLENLQHYSARLCEVRAKIQSKLDGMDLTEHNEDTYNRREEQIAALDEILDALDELIDLVANYSYRLSKKVKTVRLREEKILI